ncbi:MAG: flavoprotein, partial [Candidatus Binataceae bacterium]
MGVLKDKTIVVGVCGGIAAYKAAELVRLLTAQQARVRVMMSRNAAEFITPLTLQTLSVNPVATDT